MVRPRRTTVPPAPGSLVIASPENATTPAATLILTDLLMVPPAYEPDAITITSPSGSTCVIPPANVRQGVAISEQTLASLPETDTNTLETWASTVTDQAASASVATNS